VITISIDLLTGDLIDSDSTRSLAAGEVACLIDGSEGVWDVV
jgi:hypothetical protein